MLFRSNHKIKNNILISSKEISENQIIISLDTKKNKSIKEKNIKNEITKYQISLVSNVEFFLINGNIKSSFSKTVVGDYIAGINYSTTINNEKKITDDHIRISFLIFVSFFLSIFILSSLLVIDNIGFERSFKLSILTLTNTVNSEMYSLENFSFANLLTSSKISLIIFMIIGKIELISIFLIFKKLFIKD